MDLRSILSTDAGDSSKTTTVAPVTPVATYPPQGFRDHKQAPQASPGKQPSQDYGVQQPGGPYASPTAYQGSYPGRPPHPPPLQAAARPGTHSPARSFSAQSPYQQPPSLTASQGPFPPTHQTPQSPAQHQAHPSAQRDSYSQQFLPPQYQHQNSFSQGSPPPPPTPPIGIPGAPHPYLQHQRSQSSVSVSTPTSAQSQQQYFNHYQQQESPAQQGFPPPTNHQRRPSFHSQPGTPLGPPLTQRQSSGAFPQPASPYEQRALSSGSFSHYQQPSPAQPAPALVPHLPTTPSGYDSQRTSLSDQHRRSQSERERSLSVSPKTRLPSQPLGGAEITTPTLQNGHIKSAKRKMEERELPIDTPRRIDQPIAKPQINGEYHRASSSPQQPRKKRIRYAEPPIWAQSVRAIGLPPARNHSRSNGNRPVQGTQQQANLPPQPKPHVNGTINGRPSHVGPPPTRVDADPRDLLGLWEPSITGAAPKNQLARCVADFIFLNVVSRADTGELSSRGVQVEIEAKLGQLIDRDTNQRYHIPVRSEVVLDRLSRTSFRSQMTEHQHKCFNEFLNSKVADAHPKNPNARNRVPIDYLHRREVDKFYQLTPNLKAQLPPAIQENLNPNHAVKVRVTHDQKTGQILAKIIKARVADLDIYNPEFPLDFRISINLEMRYDGDIESLAAFDAERSPDRTKDRVSYTHSQYQIDLTQVTSVSTINKTVRPVEKEHELEVEISTDAVMEQGRRAINGQPNEYLALVEGFVNNMRVLAQACPPESSHQGQR